MKEKLYRFMMGRNGVDQYNRFLLYAAVVVLLVGMFTTDVLKFVAVALLIYAYYRTFSKKLERRRAENGRYLQMKYKLTSGFRTWRDRRKQSREFSFFRCPGCKAMLRVPRGKGKIRVTCRKCGTAFERRT